MKSSAQKDVELPKVERRSTNTRGSAGFSVGLTRSSQWPKIKASDQYSLPRYFHGCLQCVPVLRRSVSRGIRQQEFRDAYGAAHAGNRSALVAPRMEDQQCPAYCGDSWAGLFHGIADRAQRGKGTRACPELPGRSGQCAGNRRHAIPIFRADFAGHGCSARRNFYCAL